MNTPKSRIICRPLAKNYGLPKEGEKVVQCEKCGEDCIERPTLETTAFKFWPGSWAWCTKCALTAGAQHNSIDEV